ncbi:MAG: hypothetical protein RIS20_2055 [Bacteroidota bacterium]|jgi:hypothetical protein
MNRILIILVLSVLFVNEMYAQVSIETQNFTPKGILSSIFKGEYQPEKKAQKWPVSGVQALEMGSYLDANLYAYTIIDTILTTRIDTNDIKIVVLKTMLVDSSGWIQDCMGCAPQIGVAYFVKNNQRFELQFFKLNLIVNGHGFYIPKSRTQQIGPSKYAFVLTEEVMQDQGREFWFDMSNDFRGFLTYDFFSYIPAEQSSILENSIEIIPTENEYFDFMLRSKSTPTSELETGKAAKIKPVKTKLILNNMNVMQHVQMPFGYSIQNK